MIPSEPKGRPGLVAENLRRAFRAYVASGGNHEYACRLLAKDGLEISAPTMAAWAERHKFPERAKSADMLMSAAVGDGASVMRAVCMHVLQRYRLYFEESEELDPQVMMSLAAVLKTVGRYLDDGGKRGASDDERRETLRRILKYDYGIE